MATYRVEAALTRRNGKTGKTEFEFDDCDLGRCAGKNCDSCEGLEEQGFETYLNRILEYFDIQSPEALSAQGSFDKGDSVTYTDFDDASYEGKDSPPAKLVIKIIK